MPLETFFDNPSPPVPRSKSILSRLTSPLAKRSAKLFDIEIEPQHPHKTYQPGDSVKGQIVLSVLKGFDITHLTISLHGYATVFKHERAPGDAKSAPEQLINGKGSHGFEYLGNGLASLFQDEQILCGSGFLKKQVYKFGFELQFPSYSLPSTIEFERGAVNYMVSSTVTRPTPIAPTTNRIYKVKFEDKIDIQSMYTPKSRAIHLEPMSRRDKVKKVKQTSASGTQESASMRTLSRQNTSQSTQQKASSVPPPSPALSEDTAATTATGSTQDMKAVDGQFPPRKHSDDSEPQSNATSTSVHTISATTEIAHHGALPGDLIPIRVKVEHTKAARGVVIATLYRQGRIDMLPALPLANRTKAKKPEYEDVYPRSRTGLGGLYFTNGAPNMAFRKDLTQTSTLMIVDPQSKTADVNFKIRVPEQAFPTIDNIPGGMISFTYHVEVVIDLTGKLSETRMLPSLTTNGPSFSAAEGANGNQLTHDWANNILDTAPLRRTKNVAAFELPLVVGTEDTGRVKRKAELPRGQAYYGSGKENVPPQSEERGQYWHQNGHDDYSYDAHRPGHVAYHDDWYDEFGNPLYDDGSYDPESAYSRPPTNGHYHYPHDNHYNAPPPESEVHADEKTRLRRQEELLLPSQPPEDTGSRSSHSHTLAPTAPNMAMLVQHGTPHTVSSPQSSTPITISRTSARSGETVVPDPLTPPASLPDDAAMPTDAPTEDKQELERRRLQGMTSEPPPHDDNEAGPSTHERVPSAPVIDEEEYHATVFSIDGGEGLPQYRR